MSDSAVETKPVTEAVVEAGSNEVAASNEDLLKIANEVVQLLEEQRAVVDNFINLLEFDTFKFLSKTGRNEGLQLLIKQGPAIEDASKALFRALKKVRREHMSDEVADAALLNNASNSRY